MAIDAITGGGNAFAPNPQPAQSAGAAVVPAQPQAAAQPASASAPSLADVTRATQQVQQAIAARTNNLAFGFAQDAGQTVVQLTDKQSGDIILQIPSQAVIAIADQIDKTVGLFVQQKA